MCREDVSLSVCCCVFVGVIYLFISFVLLLSLLEFVPLGK